MLTPGSIYRSPIRTAPSRAEPRSVPEIRRRDAPAVIHEYEAVAASRSRVFVPHKHSSPDASLLGQDVRGRTGRNSGSHRSLRNDVPRLPATHALRVALQHLELGYGLPDPAEHFGNLTGDVDALLGLLPSSVRRTLLPHRQPREAGLGPVSQQV